MCLKSIFVSWRREKEPLSLRSDERLTLETSALELYGGQITSSTQLLKPNYLIISSTDVTPQFLQKPTPFIHYPRS